MKKRLRLSGAQSASGIIAIQSTKMRSLRVNVVLVSCVAIILFVRLKEKLAHDSGLKSFVSPSSCTIEMINSMNLEQDDPCILKILREQYLIEPSNGEYHLTHSMNADPSVGQSKKILNLMQHKENGFFIECGGYDGETRSNTVYMEKKLGWSGLLIEADSVNFEKMKLLNRKSWISPSCLSVIPRPQEVTFNQNKSLGKIVTNAGDDHKSSLVRAQCFPLYSYLVAMNRTIIDYFSLDVEGLEMEVLKTIPWDKVNIKTLSVEYEHIREGNKPEGKAILRNYMIQQGYTVAGEVVFDLIFAKA